MRHLQCLLHRRSDAFTLIELLVVIVILGILMAVAVPTFLRQQTKAQDSRTQQYLTTAYKAIRAGTPDTNNQYPSSTSMVSWIQQSEPELTAQRGDCLTGVTTAPVDAVLVDPSSTSNSLQLCARSQSGNVWKLTASATGVQQLLDGTLVPLTMSGNEVTDGTRAADVQGDGLSNDSSTGIWEGTTNLVTNGGFETNSTGWADFNGHATSVRDTTEHKFGSASLKVTTIDGLPYAGSYYNTLTYTAGVTYTISAWVKGPPGISLAIGYSSATGPNVAATGSWQRISYSFTASSGDNRVYVLQRTGAVPSTFWVDGVQAEQKPVATPYVETSGATVSRSVSFVSVPAGVLDSQQGWIAMRMRMGWASNAALTFAPRPFDWRTCPSGCFIRGFAWNGGTGRWQWAGIGDIGPSGFSWNAGDYVTLIGAWTTSGSTVTMKISDNGSAFSGDTNATQAGSITSAATIGSAAGGSPIDADVLWFATGTGTLADADAATIDSWGNNDPKRASFPTAAQATMVWNGASATGSLK